MIPSSYLTHYLRPFVSVEESKAEETFDAYLLSQHRWFTTLFEFYGVLYISNRLFVLHTWFAISLNSDIIIVC